MVKTYSLKAHGGVSIARNFRVREFACPDGTDTILISTELLDYLQQIREHFGKPVKITSGYRTAAYNKKIGGADGSTHTRGLAADIQVDGVAPEVVAYYAANGLNMPGVECGCYESNGYVHIDVREGKWRAIKAYSNKPYETVSSLFSTVRKGSRGQTVVMLQRSLKAAGYYNGSVDGDFGAGTHAAVVACQQAMKAAGKYMGAIDGIVGAKTYALFYGS